MNIIEHSTTGRSGTGGKTYRIVLVTETFAPEVNGVANTLRYLCEGLIARHHHVTVIRPAPKGRTPSFPESATCNPLFTAANYQEVLVPGIPLPCYPGLRLGLAASGRLRRDWKKLRPDAVYLATQGPLGWSAQKIAAELGIPTCAGFHTNFQSYSQYYGMGFLERLISRYLKYFHNRAGTTLVPTRNMQLRIEALGVKRTAIWSRGVDCEQFRPAARCPILRAEWGSSRDDLAILYVGRLAPEKNLMQAVVTFERIRNIYPRARLVLVGDGPLRQRLQERHRDYLFCGTRKGEDLAKHFASGDLLLFPSKTDTFGNVVLEAMASGLAVVAYNDGAAAEHIEDQVNGMKVAISDDEAFTQAALRLADQPSLRRKLSRAARTKARALSWDILTQQFEELIFRPRTEVHSCADQQSIPII